jgi:hypothetical protein
MEQVIIKSSAKGNFKVTRILLIPNDRLIYRALYENATKKQLRILVDNIDDAVINSTDDVERAKLMQEQEVLTELLLKKLKG